MKAGTSGPFPNLIIAGAPKCGTSSLFFWLGAHPEVCASKLKETYFLADKILSFNRNLNIHEHGLMAYKHYFSHCKDEKYRVEATPVYIYQQTPLEYIPKMPIKPIVVFILRKPSDRLYSHWKFNRYRMKNTKMSFEEYLDFKNAPSGWENYLEHTRYVNYLDLWVRTVGKENIFVYQFESMQKDKHEFMRKISGDLGIDANFYKDFNYFHRNQTVSIKKKWLHTLGLKIEPKIPRQIHEIIIPYYLKVNSRKVPIISDRDLELKDEVSKMYRLDNNRLKELFPSIDLTLW